MDGKIMRSEKEWRAILTDEEFRILREKGTEAPFAGKYWRHSDEGIYLCAGCGLPLFGSAEKFDSGSGWPSFSAPVNDDNIREMNDDSFGMVRTEVLCARCGGHLGHVFEDISAKTGLRYCINSAALLFEKDHADKLK